MTSRTIITRDSDPAGLIARFTMPPAFYKRVNETRFRQEWVLTRLQHLCLRLGWDGEGDPRHWMMSVFKGPRFQRGMLSGMSVKRAITAGDGGSVVLTAHTTTDNNFSSGTASVAFRFNTDGLLESNRSNQADIDHSGEWWDLEPVGSVGDDYAARHLASGKSGTYSTEAAAADNWITMTALRQWTVSQTGVGDKNCTATFECGPEPSGPADDSASITIEAHVESGGE